MNGTASCARHSPAITCVNRPWTLNVINSGGMDSVVTHLLKPTCAAWIPAANGRPRNPRKNRAFRRRRSLFAVFSAPFDCPRQVLRASPCYQTTYERHLDHSVDDIAVSLPRRRRWQGDYRPQGLKRPLSGWHALSPRRACHPRLNHACCGATHTSQVAIRAGLN